MIRRRFLGALARCRGEPGARRLQDRRDARKTSRRRRRRQRRRLRSRRDGAARSGTQGHSLSRPPRRARCRMSMALARSNPDEAGRKYGYRAKEGSEPWTFAVNIDGRIVAAETTSRAATISVDTEGDGKVAAIVQIGPAMRGTALRDSPRLRLFQRLQEPDRLRAIRQSVQQHAAQDISLAIAARLARRAQCDGARRLHAGGRRPAAAGDARATDARPRAMTASGRTTT